MKVGSSLQWYYPTLNGEVGIVFKHLGCGLLRLLHVAEPAVSGGEVGVRPLSLIAAGDRLVAPFDRLLPMRKMGVQVANIVLPPRHVRIARAQPQGGLDLREAILGAAEKDFIEAEVGKGGCVVTIVGDRLFRLGDRRAPLVLTEIDLNLSEMGQRVVRLNGQGGVNRLFRACEVAGGVVIGEIGCAARQSDAETDQSLDVIRIKGTGALE